MKQLSILFFLFIIISCKNKDKQPASPERSSISGIEEPAFNCFNGPDTVVVAGTTKGCHSHYFKLLDDSSVLRIEYKGDVQYDSCMTIRIDSMHRNGMVKLLLYETRKADFVYFCNDYGSGPEREIEAIGGTVYFRFYAADKNESGSHDYRVSIWVQDLEFWDNVRKAKIEIDNVLYYKVPNWKWFAG